MLLGFRKDTGQISSENWFDGCGLIMCREEGDLWLFLFSAKFQLVEVIP